MVVVNEIGYFHLSDIIILCLFKKSGQFHSSSFVQSIITHVFGYLSLLFNQAGVLFVNLLLGLILFLPTCLHVLICLSKLYIINMCV